MSSTALSDWLRVSLAEFEDPYLEANYIATECVQSCEVTTDCLNLHICLPYPAALVKEQIEDALTSHLSSLLIEQAIKLVLTISHKVLRYENENAVKPMDNIKNIIAVGSGKGGVGKSTTAINLALALQRSGAEVGVLDADIYGPNLGLMLGVDPEQRPEVEAEKYFLPIKAQGLQSMSMSYVTTENTPMVWRGPKASGAFQQLLNSTLWHELDYLIVDMPPGTGDIQLTLSQMAPLTAAVIVTTPQNMATQDARKGIEMFKKVSVPILGVIENMSTHICEACGHEDHLFGDGGGKSLADQCGAHFLGMMPLQKRLREGMDQGAPIVAQNIEDDLSQRYLSIALNIAAQLALQLKPKSESQGIKLVES